MSTNNEAAYKIEKLDTNYWVLFERKLCVHGTWNPLKTFFSFGQAEKYFYDILCSGQIDNYPINTTVKYDSEGNYLPQ